MNDGAGVVIVGTGIAGITAAETLRSAGYPGPVTVLGDEPHLPYRRTALSKDLLNADLRHDKIRLRKPEFWSERDISIRTGTRVVAVDTGTREIICGDGESIAYDALVLATGGRPRTVDAIAAEVPNLRQHDDAVALQRALACQPVVIIGGGLIGLEIAASAAASASSVTVLESAPTLLTRVLPAGVAAPLLDLHRANGVQIRTGVDIVAATPETVTTADGSSFGGTVVSAIGMVPNTALAQAVGAEVGPVGIVVDTELRTTVPHVYAVGDVAARPHPLTGAPARAEQWMTATDHGKLVAATVLADSGFDAPEAPPISRVPLAWTIHYSRNMQLAGWPGLADRVAIDGSVDDFDATVRCYEGNVLLGGVTLGRPAAGRAMRTEIEQGLQTRVTP